MGLLSEVFRDPANLDKLTGMAAIGHVRYATAGEDVYKRQAERLC